MMTQQNASRNHLRDWSVRLVLLAVSCALLPGCPLFKRKSCKCEATLSYKGKEIKRKGYGYCDAGEKKPRKDAVRRVCEAYCTAADPAVQSAYIAYKKTAAGQQSKIPRDSALLSEPPLKKHVEACRQRCIANGTADGNKPTLKCSKMK